MPRIKPVVNNKNGFSILEVMVAVAIISALGLGIYRLQLSELSSSQQALTRQLMMQSANNMANQIYAHMNYCSTSGISRAGACSSASNYSYTETSYSDHASSASIVDCTSQTCNDSQYAGFALYRWKSSFSNMNIPQANVFGLVCRDSSFAIPTSTSPNCNGSGNLVVKMAWQSHIEDAESITLGSNNYIILRVPQR